MRVCRNGHVYQIRGCLMDVCPICGEPLMGEQESVEEVRVECQTGASSANGCENFGKRPG